ncbi:hypothetical protein COU61_01270 [Candidatus Pacearchaeota archaeon CG10_big_fil_rev_8_21_14_0_10_35_13]|nr:MAG: hypothetical protein COU61_01270 [Candidatus Pacearchaeota archaeon CG10_big_fil_rev_8_21_14_0_10_35_13]
MKKTLAVLMLLVMIASVLTVSLVKAGEEKKIVAYDDSEGILEVDGSVDVEVETTVGKAQDRGRAIIAYEQELLDKTRTRIENKIDNANQLRERIREREQELKEQIKDFKEEKKTMIENQNRVRVAVHALLSMEGLVGGIGKNVSEIAREFNNSEQAIIRAEERIETRSKFKRFFAGGNEEAGKELKNHAEKYQERIDSLEELKNQCIDCDAETIIVLDEQLELLKAEKVRIELRAETETKTKGLFGWLWK